MAVVAAVEIVAVAQAAGEVGVVGAVGLQVPCRKYGPNQLPIPRTKRNQESTLTITTRVFNTMGFCCTRAVNPKP